MSSPARTRALSVSSDKARNGNLKDVENYYKNIKKNLIDFQYEFTVNLKKKDKTRQLLYNLKENTIQIFKLSKKGNKKSKLKKYQMDDFERICKDRSDNKLLILTKKGGKKELLLSFLNPERRESLYELLWLSRGDRTKTVPSKEEKAPFDKISLFITTWNVGDAQPSAEQLHHWIPNKNQHDIYVIGVQECDYQPSFSSSSSNSSSSSSSNATSTTGSSNPSSSSSTPISTSPPSTPPITVKSHTPPSSSGSQTDCAEHWFQMLSNHLGHNYFKLQSISLVKMRLVVFVKKEHYYKINHIERESEATGVAGIYGNKGATAISFKFLESSFLFINSHFAAHQEKIEQRNQNYRDIIKGLNMGSKSKTDILNQFHHVFWMGDFNYRIDLFREETLVAIQSKNLGKLVGNDQLGRQKLSERVFVGFREPPIKFMPTYKMERNTVGVYTTEKSRVPSYCDRILYKPLPCAPMTSCTQYDSATTVTTSDHNPVFAVYETYVQRPCLPTQRNQSKCTIELLDVGALQLDLDENGAPPDPYLFFHPSTFLTSPVETAHASASRCPVWGDLPPLVPCIYKKSFLENQHLLISVLDYRESPPRKIGYASIPLMLGFTKEPYSFQTRITKYGVSSGILYGKIHIISEDEQQQLLYNVNQFPTTTTTSSTIPTTPSTATSTTVASTSTTTTSTATTESNQPIVTYNSNNPNQNNQNNNNGIDPSKQLHRRSTRKKYKQRLKLFFG
ncbi:inositol 5-phosphatase [Cavenderia fasciculata]|uniref:Inositol 5-phosphatase n=1 Tax=Cavenderia fasciculata TaxID=261658 RepID=F4Q584_CACFS|nr:inositol 5-phosphatase [Cavenderia fasciculata]EGG17143.1 inositol 5-phosphatase [Cavenderia fasciculata]|eukprot:XP_004355627.1 inositol 5-phosphatase [Cavenderia fasciculata]